MTENVREKFPIGTRVEITETFHPSYVPSAQELRGKIGTVFGYGKSSEYSESIGVALDAPLPGGRGTIYVPTARVVTDQSPHAPTLESVTVEHAEALSRAYTLRTFGDRSEVGVLSGYLFALVRAGVVRFND